MTAALFYPIGKGDITEWGLRCAHGTTTTQDVAGAFRSDQILNRLVAARIELPADASDVVCSIVAVRSLLGILHTTRWGCDCGVLPQPLAGLLREADGGPVQ